MRREEVRAVAHGRPYDEGTELPGRLSEDLPVHQPGAMRALVVPFVLLVAGVFAGILWSGYSAAGEWDAVAILAETDTSLALLWGGVLGLAAALAYYFLHTRANPQFAAGTFGRGWVEGVRSMMPAVSILLLAWMLGGLIDQLGTGEYLGRLVEGANIDAAWLVPLTFVIALAMAFATGTSWGSFALLLPLAGGIVNAVDAPELLLPVFGAVLAGAVAGDHASPISDTTILSATGASCNVITHVLTQLPYAVIAAIAALAGYVAVAVGAGTGLGLLVTLAALAALVAVAKAASRSAQDEAAEVTAEAAV